MSTLTQPVTSCYKQHFSNPNVLPCLKGDRQTLPLPRAPELLNWAATFVLVLVPWLMEFLYFSVLRRRTFTGRDKKSGIANNLKVYI